MKARRWLNKWPSYFGDEGRFSEEYIAFSEDMAVCYDLVKVAAAVLEKRLVLRAGGPRTKPPISRAATDGTNIFLPKMHPQRRLATKHELAHIYFDSNIPLRLAFVKALLREIEQRSTKKFSSLVYSKLTEDLCFLINIFDDVRVNSLWGVLYPGDGEKFDAWYKETVGPRMLESAQDTYPDGDVSHLFTYCILICLEQDVVSSQWGHMRHLIEEARDRVHYKSFRACLAIVRDLLLTLAQGVAEEEKPPPAWGGSPSLGLSDEDEQIDADSNELVENDDLEDLVKSRLSDAEGDSADLVDAFTKIETERAPGKAFDDPSGAFDHTTAPAVGAAEEDEAANILLVDDLDEFLDREEADQMQRCGQLQVSMQAVIARTRDDRSGLLRNVKTDVNLIRVQRSDIVPVVLDHGDVEVAKRWKRHFQKVIGAMRRRVAPVGYELVPALYIQQRLQRQPLVCYRRPMAGRGFRLTVLVDMSGSMWNCFDQVERLYRVLQISLDFPFVELSVMGFNSTSKGEVNIYMFPPRAQGLRSAKSFPNGITPLSHAIQVAGQGMVGCRHESFLFVLSDGMPVYQTKSSGQKGRNRFVNLKTLINWTASAVEDLRRQRVQTYCFMIGSWTPEENSMNAMFGEAYWRQIRQDAIFEDSFGFVRGQFLRYLRTR